MQEFELTLSTLLTLVLGGAGWYLLLPRGMNPRDGFLRYVGGLLATLSLVLTAWQFGAVLPNKTNELTFYLLAAVSVGAAILMIASANPILAALWFALVLLANSGLFLLQGAEFLSAATVIIYAGAIIVTFLFVIMLAQPRGTAQYDRYSREPFLSCTAGVILAWTLLGAVHHSASQETSPLNQRPQGALVGALPSPETVSQSASLQAESVIKPEIGHVDGLGRTLFVEHYVSVEVIGMLLLVAVVGAVLIVNRGQTTPAGKVGG